jgi:glycosyltransferase involved in cell wall biosynthesis
MKNSLPASILAWMEAIWWNRERLEKLTDRFISPSNFLKDKMVSAGFKAERIEVLNNFMYQQTPPVADKEDYFCYVGRLSEEKGVDTLLKAASRLPLPLKIIGDGPLSADFKKQYGNSAHIEFMGRMTSEQLFPVVQKARFLTIPSVCYENNPYSVIEALCMGTPVLGANIGGIPELIDTDENGDLFLPGDVDGLQSKITECFNYNYNFMKIATEAQNKFAPETFYKKLITVYDH